MPDRACVGLVERSRFLGRAGSLVGQQPPEGSERAWGKPD